jgi:hypothetical protein
MTDRTIPQLKAVLKKYLKKWKNNLYLGMWQIDFNIREYLKNEQGEFETAATCDANWQYFYASLNFSYAKMRELADIEIEKIVLHEMLHVVVNEMREDGIDHEERVVSHLTMICEWMDK